VQSIPHARALVERLKNEPFALVGVNTDSNKDKYKNEVGARQVTWRSAWTGSTSNPISRLFKVSGYPTVFIIDHKGLIRRRFVGAPPQRELDTLLEKLIAEAKADSK